MTCLSRYEQTAPKSKMQGFMLNKFKEPEEFIETLIKRLKISNSTFTLSVNLYKLLKKFSLLKLSTKSMHYFKIFFGQIIS